MLPSETSSDSVASVVIAAFMLIGIVLAIEFGRWIGLRRQAADPRAREGVNVVEGSIFGLMGLLIAFTFSGAIQRFDHRRKLVVDEANCIATAYLRLDLLPAERQPAIRELFRKYIDSRMKSYQAISSDFNAAKQEYRESMKLFAMIWAHAVAACQEPSSNQRASMLLLPALTNMSEMTTTRAMALFHHPPEIILWMLVGFALICSVMAGDAIASHKRSWVHITVFALSIALTTYVTLDIEYPRQGLIRVDDFDRVLQQTRERMN